MTNNKHIIYATPQDSCHTIQRLIDDAVIEKWRREATTLPAASKLLLHGATIQHIHQSEERHD